MKNTDPYTTPVSLKDLDFQIPSGSTKPRKAVGPKARWFNTQSKEISRKIAIAEDVHQGIDDETQGTI